MQLNHLKQNLKLQITQGAINTAIEKIEFLLNPVTAYFNNEIRKY